MYKSKPCLGCIFVLVYILILSGCLGEENISIFHYYDYDHDFPLRDSLRLVENNERYDLYESVYYSVHESRVTGLLTIPKTGHAPYPVIIFLHGIKDDKAADYMQLGHQFLVDSGYAVLRIDGANHGNRKTHEHKYNFVTGFRFWTRDLLTQTVFDLRRGIDFLEKRPEIDTKRIGYLGISLGGVIGTVFCGVEERVKVPVIALAGGGLQFVFKFDAFTSDVKNYISIIDPLNFVGAIAPRPLLMINAENDEVVPPLSSRLLYEKAGEPKKIIWYPTKHREVPQADVYPQSIRWFKSYL
jgi:cephalosporin-C deacetylase-like acetyl esterase